jgi:hypothetical protein
MTTDVLSMWTIYRSPADHPGKYVARRFELDRPNRDVLIADNLVEVRAPLLARGLYRLDRYPDDDPVIVEVWL